ncbi:MAG: hypothetical protein ABI876_14600 [Bacteroidota bacterium]
MSNALPRDSCSTDTVSMFLWYEVSDDFSWLEDAMLKPHYFILADPRASVDPYKDGLFDFPVHFQTFPFFVWDNIDYVCKDVYDDMESNAAERPGRTDIRAYLDTLRTLTYDTSFVHILSDTFRQSFQWKLVKVAMVVTFVNNLWVKVNDLQNNIIPVGEHYDGIIRRKLPYYYIWDILSIEPVMVPPRMDRAQPLN